jgi:UDP-N-acetylglucosamine 1-carboxyvinyltransferase
VTISGAKNSVLKLMAACILAPGEHLLDNVPHIRDVEIMNEILAGLGVHSSWTSRNQLLINCPSELATEVPAELASRMRASIVLLGPLTARQGRGRISVPGGDDFGPRPIDFHLRGLEAMGAKIDSRSDMVTATAASLKAARIVLEYPSHTATDNLMMAAALAEGTTVIENAAREPEVADLANFLNQMGAQIEGGGTSRLVIEGRRTLHPACHRVVPDRLEAATFLASVAFAGGEIEIDDARADHMDMVIAKLGDMGVRVAPTSRGLWVRGSGSIRSVDVSTLPYPGVATDYKPLLLTLLCKGDGVATVTENVFISGRFRYLDELRKLGANVATYGHHAVVVGRERLIGAPVVAHDIRAGAALVVAGLGSEGSTEISGIDHIYRGYDRLSEKLRELGAVISEVS